MGLGSFFKGKKKEKPSREEVILETRIQLEKMKEKYEILLETQRKILRKDPTPYEKAAAESKIRSGICAYTIVTQASRDLDQITSDYELNTSLKVLNQSLKNINRLSDGKSVGTQKTLDREIKKMKKREGSLEPTEIFSEEALGTVDEWLGLKWDSIANKYINQGLDLKDCLQESKIILESNPMPYMDEFYEALGKRDSMKEDAEDVDADLRDLLNGDHF